MKHDKAVYDNCIKRGYIEIENVLYPPSQVEELIKSGKYTPTDKKSGLKRLKSSRIKTAWIDDTLNIKNRDTRKDPFTALLLHDAGLIAWPEFRFLLPPLPDYRFDYAIPIYQDNILLKIAIEVNGGIWARGASGHSSGTGITRDMDKASLAAVNGWILIQRVPSQLCILATLDLIRQAAASKGVILPSQ